MHELILYHNLIPIVMKVQGVWIPLITPFINDEILNRTSD
jgi:hypothetical protein